VATRPPAIADCKTPEEQIKCAAACDAKQYTACATLGLAIINSGDRATLARGVELVDTACANKDPLGCGALGSLYMGGIGVVRDRPRALKLFEGACAAGDGISCESLGGYYMMGGGGERNPEQAALWYERACAMQRPSPCLFLAVFIHDGVKFPSSDHKRIPALLETACKGDVAVACKLLGDLYAKGELVRRDVTRSNALYA
jgi:TPR repeat protein